MNKTELIDRIALLEMLPQICDELNGCAAPYNFDEHCVGCEVYMLHKMLTDMPTIDAAPVRRGEWVNRDYITTAYGHIECADCTNCGALEVPLDKYDNFCPNCGADMRGVSE